MSQLLEAPALERDPSIDQSIDSDELSTVAIMAEYDDVSAVMTATERVRKAGYTRIDVHSPFPIHGIDPVAGIRPTILPWIVLCFGLTGLTTAVVMQHYTNGIEIPSLEGLSGYPFFISGKPLWSTPAFVPIMFELTVLFSAFSAMFGMLLLNGLPMHFNPLLRSHRFRRATDDRFFLVIETTDPKYDEVETIQLLRSTKPVALERVED
ncbi:MAG: DUF3341 domain-containing protein [Tepidisphaeraceae bacterium]